MHNNAFVLYRYASFLHSKIHNQRLNACVSTSSNDIHFLFSNGFYFLVRFYKEHTFFLLPETSHFPKKNILHQFKSCIDQTVVDVNTYPNDRGIQIQFDTQVIHLQCFGRRSGILLVSNEEVLDSFKNLTPRENYNVTNKQVVFSSNENDFLRENPFFPKELKGELIAKGLFDSEAPQSAWESICQDINERDLYIVKLEGEKYKLTFLQTENIVSTYQDVGEALHDFGKLYVAHDRHNDLKKSLLQELHRDIKKQEKRRILTEKHLNKISSGNNFKEIADILMANLHAIEPGSKTTELFDFYHNKIVQIPLKSNLSAQKVHDLLLYGDLLLVLYVFDGIFQAYVNFLVALPVV